MLGDAGGILLELVGFLVGDEDSWSFGRIVWIFLGFFRILKNCSGFLGILKDSWGFFKFFWMFDGLFFSGFRRDPLGF